MLDSGIRLLPRVFDGEAFLRPGVKHMGWWQPLSGQPVDPCPGHSVLLTAPLQRAPPQIDDVMPICPNRVGVGRHRVIREVTGDHQPQSPTLIGQAVVALSPHFVLDLPQGRTHAVRSRMASKLERSKPRAATDEREPQEVERLNVCSLPCPLRCRRSIA